MADSEREAWMLPNIGMRHATIKNKTRKADRPEDER
jgi:hypothetical protein